MFAQTRLVVAVAAALALSGCATDSMTMKNDGPLFFGAANNPATAGDEGGVNKVEPKGKPQPVIFHGDGKLVNLPKESSVSVDKVEGDKVALNFEQVPLTDLIHSVLGKLLHVDYSIDQPIKGEVTLHTGAPVARSQLLPILQSYLQANGALMVKGADGIYHIGPTDAMRALSTGVQSAQNIQPGYSTVIIPLRYIGAAQMAKILKPVAPPQAFVLVDGSRNLLMLAGTKAQLEGWMQIIHSFDVDMLKGMSVGIFPIENGSVTEIAKAIDTLLSSGGKGSNALSGGLVRVMPIKRLSSLLVVTPRAHYLDTIKTWINRLDRPPENDFEPTLYVYPVQNGSATHLAKLLNNLFGGGSGGEGGGASSIGEGSGVAPGLATSTISSSANGSSSSTGFGASATSSTSGSSMLNNGGSSTATGGRASSNSISSMLSGGARGSGGNPGDQGGTSVVSLNNQVKVVADEENNALLIYARHKDYEKIAKALRSLDVSPTQVLIEASIIEVTLTGDLQYGLEWYLQGGLGNGYTGGASLNFNSSGEIAPQQPGFSYTISNSAGVVRAVLNALAKKSLVKVISSPSVMVLDNHTATIQVGDQQPIQTQSSVTQTAVTSSITYKDTGVILSVTPSVNAGGLVRMKIQQAVTDVGSVDSATGQRSFLQRQIQSQVAVRSGQTVVLGGLIKNNATQGKTGIPLLSDIPGLGNLFSTTTKSTNRTELLVMITPRVLRNQKDLGEITREMQERMTSLHTLPGWRGGAKEQAKPKAEPAAAGRSGD